MKGLGISSKMMSMLFLLAILFISLALSGYTYLVSQSATTSPIFTQVEYGREGGYGREGVCMGKDCENQN